MDKQAYAPLVHPKSLLSDVFHFIGNENAFVMTWDIKFPYFIPIGLTNIIYSLIIRLLLLQKNRH